MVDDFWGQAEWDGVMRNINRALPGCEVVDLPRSHPIFHCVCDMPDPLNLPDAQHRLGQDRNRNTGITWEDDHVGGNARDPHFRAILDDKGRMMVFLCHNTRQRRTAGEGRKHRSLVLQRVLGKKNYPLAINVIYYVMTH
jgi:hypothetical protein